MGPCLIPHLDPPFHLPVSPQVLVPPPALPVVGVRTHHAHRPQQGLRHAQQLRRDLPRPAVHVRLPPSGGEEGGREEVGRHRRALHHRARQGPRGRRAKSLSPLPLPLSHPPPRLSLSPTAVQVREARKEARKLNNNSGLGSPSSKPNQVRAHEDHPHAQQHSTTSPRLLVCACARVCVLTVIPSRLCIAVVRTATRTRPATAPASSARRP